MEVKHTPEIIHDKSLRYAEGMAFMCVPAFAEVTGADCMQRSEVKNATKSSACPTDMKTTLKIVLSDRLYIFSGVDEVDEAECDNWIDKHMTHVAYTLLIVSMRAALQRFYMSSL